MIPRSALLLGLAGLIPFLFGTALVIGPTLPFSGADGTPLLDAADGRAIVIHYGIVIACFMSGALWGFATRADADTAPRAYALSVLPALWVFFLAAPGHGLDLPALILGFAGLLALDLWFWSQNLAPAWWMRLRILLTVVVVACLSLVWRG